MKLQVYIPYNCKLETTRHGFSYLHIDCPENMKDFGEKLMGLGVQAIQDARNAEKKKW